MEEDLKIIKKIIYDKQGKRMNYIDIYNVVDNECNDFIQAIENLIARNKELKDLYNKEKIKNRNVEMLRIACLPDNAKMVVMYKDDFNRNWRNDFIPKSRVKEKIEELKKKMEEDEVDEFGIHTIGWSCLDYVVEVLQELLEEN